MIAESARPEVGELVQVRGQQWVVTGVSRSTLPLDEIAATRPDGHTLVHLSSVSDADIGVELTVVWEVEPSGRLERLASRPVSP
ncbi:MAG: hypothetical protein ACRCYX_02870 [Dermatophilaceae bacterium]